MIYLALMSVTHRVYQENIDLDQDANDQVHPKLDHVYVGAAR